MFSKQVKVGRRFAVRFGKGEEIISSLENFAREKNLGFSTVHIIGAVEDINLGYLELKEPENQVIKNSFQGSHEFLAIGNISLKEGKHSAHMHAFIGTREKKIFGGHLISAKVSVTVEGIIYESEEKIGRKNDPSVKYPVLDL